MLLSRALMGPRLASAGAPAAADPPVKPDQKADPPKEPEKKTDPELEAERKKVAKLEAAAKERADKEKAAADAKRVADEGASVVLKERDKELADLRAKFETLTNAEKERGEKIYAALPEAARKKLDLVKDKLDVTTYVALLEAERDLVTPTTEITAPPPSGGGAVPPKGGPPMSDKFKPAPEVVAFLGNQSPASAESRIKTLKTLSITREGDNRSMTKHGTIADFIKVLQGARGPIGKLVGFKGQAKA